MATNAPTTGASWHNVPATRAYLASLSPDQFHVHKSRGLSEGFDSVTLTGEPVELLGNARAAWIDARFGMDFAAACDAGRVDELFAFEDAQLPVDAVVQHYFGADLLLCNRWDMRLATAEWRSLARARAAVREAA